MHPVTARIPTGVAGEPIPSEPSRRHRWARHAGRWSIAGVAAGLCWLAFRDVDWQGAVGMCTRIGAGAALLLVPQLCALLLETCAWQRMIEQAGHRAAYYRLFVVRAATESIGQLLPAGVVWCESLKPALLERHCGLPIPAGVAATAHRKWLRVAAHGPYLILAGLLSFGTLSGLSRVLIGGPALEWILPVCGLGLGVSAFLFACLLARGALAKRAGRLLERLGVPARFSSSNGFVSTDRLIAQPFSAPLGLGAPLGLTLLAWSMEAFESLLIVWLLGSSLGIAEVAGVDALTSLARQILVVLPAGAGVQEFSYTTALRALDVEDVMTLGAAFVLLKRVKELAWAAIGCAALAALRRAHTVSRPVRPAFHPSG
jgi:hypothetical protein